MKNLNGFPKYLVLACIFSVVLVFSCKSPPLGSILMINSPSKFQKKSLSLLIKMKELDADSLTLIPSQKEEVLIGCSIHSTIPTQIILDWHAFTTKTHNAMDQLKLKNIDPNLDSIITNIDFSQVLIENTAGQYRFYSAEKQFKSREIIAFDGYYSYLNNHFEKINMSSNDYYYFEFPTKKIDLKIELEDKEIRLHYLYKPNQEQASLGFEPLILTSNWLTL